jgi:hypothetical protein
MGVVTAFGPTMFLHVPRFTAPSTSLFWYYPFAPLGFTRAAMNHLPVVHKLASNLFNDRLHVLYTLVSAFPRLSRFVRRLDRFDSSGLGFLTLFWDINVLIDNNRQLAASQMFIDHQHKTRLKNRVTRPMSPTKLPSSRFTN